MRFAVKIRCATAPIRRKHGIGASLLLQIKSCMVSAYYQLPLLFMVSGVNRWSAVARD